MDKMASSPSPSHSASDAAVDTASNTSSNYGGIDPEVEENLYILPYVSDEGLRDDATDRRKTIGTSPDDYYPLPLGPHAVTSTGESAFVRPCPISLSSNQASL